MTAPLALSPEQRIRCLSAAELETAYAFVERELDRRTGKGARASITLVAYQVVQPILYQALCDAHDLEAALPGPPA